MRVNIIIRIEDCEDNEQAMETKFENCETAALLAKDSLQILHPLVRKYHEMFPDMGAPNLKP